MDINKPAYYLKGSELSEGWTVIDLLPTDGTETLFVNYLVKKGNAIAFLKALDFSRALLDEEPTKALGALSQSYEFETELYEVCKEKRLTKIVNILGKGKIPSRPGSIIPVPYIILEYAEKDLKSQIDFDSRLNTIWLLKILHNVTTGVWQLHKNHIAHQNLNTSTIKSFSPEVDKITELSSANKKGYESPMGKYRPFDISTTPPELLYGHYESNWIYKNQASDAYQLGSLIVFLYSQCTMTTLLKACLDESHSWNKWGGSYADVLPYVLNAFEEAIACFAVFVEEPEIKETLKEIVRQLCHPDPRKRGHPLNIASIGSSLSVERYITMFDRMAKKLETKK